MQQPKPITVFTFLITLAVVVVFWGCKKDPGTTEIFPVIPKETDTLPTMVRVVRGITLTPIPGAEVFLFQTDEDGHSILADHQYTDEDGYCYWDEEDEIKEVCAQADGYMGICDGGAYGLVYDLFQGYMFRKTAYAWLKVYVIDEPPVIDHIYITVAASFDFPSIQGVSEDNPIVIRRPGDSPYNLHLVALSTINQSLIFSIDTILTAPAFDTLEFTYHY